MTFLEFKAWFDQFDAQLGGKTPELNEWWELKARLEAVGPGKKVEKAAFYAENEPLQAVSRETEISDLEDVDLSSFSDDKDGGLTAQAVRIHRRGA